MAAITKKFGSKTTMAVVAVLVSQTVVLAKGHSGGGGGGSGGANSSALRSSFTPHNVSNQVKSLNVQQFNNNTTFKKLSASNLTNTTPFQTSNSQTSSYLPSVGSLKIANSRFNTPNTTSSVLPNPGVLAKNPRLAATQLGQYVDPGTGGTGGNTGGGTGGDSKKCEDPCKHHCSFPFLYPFPYPFPFGQFGGFGIGVVVGGVIYSQPAVAQGTANVDLVVEGIKLSQGPTLIAGPAYRVKFRNQGLQAAGPFRVAVLAALDGQMTDSKAIADVPGLAAGEAREVTLRLPAASMKLVSTSSTTPVAFSHLVVVVDPDSAVLETDKTNNVATVERTALEPQK